MLALEVKNLRKSYGDFQALKGVDLEVEDGEIFAILGPNGAGKTTLLRILAEGLGYDEGEVNVFGEPLSKKSARHIGYVPQESISYDLLTVKENLGFYADLYDAPREEVDNLISKFDLPPSSKAKELSGGLKRRLNLAISLLYDPKVLILDEPSTGLDVPSRKQLWEDIIKFRESGKTILIATHYMEEAELLSDRLTIMDSGRIIRTGKIEALKSLLGDRTVIHVSGILRGVDNLRKMFPRLIERRDSIRVHSDVDNTLSIVVEHLISSGSRIREIRVEEPTLEDVFLELTGKKLN